MRFLGAFGGGGGAAANARRASAALSFDSCSFCCQRCGVTSPSVKSKEKVQATSTCRLQLLKHGDVEALAEKLLLQVGGAVSTRRGTARRG